MTGPGRPRQRSADGTGPPRPGPDPDFTAGVERLREQIYRPEIVVASAPGPARLAPHSLALTAEVIVGDEQELGSGRLVLLHDPAGQPAWDGSTRCVAYVDAAVEAELAADPLLQEVAWTWLLEGLDREGAGYRALGATVTRVQSQSFGVMSDREDDGRVQIRASWTPAAAGDIDAHARAWTGLLAVACGLTPAISGLASP